MCGDQRTTFEIPFSLSIVWVPAIELWLLGLAKDAFPIEPSLACLEFYTSYTTTSGLQTKTNNFKLQTEVEAIGDAFVLFQGGTWPCSDAEGPCGSGG